jgi:hypothetical protein
MNAMLHQLSPQTVVTKFEKITKASEDLISTDLPLSEVDRFIELALKARSQPVRTVSFVPPLINTAHPDIAKIHQTVRSALAPRKAKKPAAATAGKAAPRSSMPSSHQGTTGGAIGSLHSGYAANQADDLGSAC